jgi:hypothetical protein
MARANLSGAIIGVAASLAPFDRLCFAVFTDHNSFRAPRGDKPYAAYKTFAA